MTKPKTIAPEVLALAEKIFVIRITGFCQKVPPCVALDCVKDATAFYDTLARIDAGESESSIMETPSLKL